MARPPSRRFFSPTGFVTGFSLLNDFEPCPECFLSTFKLTFSPLPHTTFHSILFLFTPKITIFKKAKSTLLMKGYETYLRQFIDGSNMQLIIPVYPRLPVSCALLPTSS